jgi:hypothetical protein
MTIPITWISLLLCNFLLVTVGISHVRYDAEGKAIFHQDYWDTGAVCEKIPVMGAVIRWIKKKF